MEGDATLRVLISALLILANAFFVAAEYGLVGTKRTRIEALARKGSAPAKVLLHALDQVSRYVAGIQIAITMCGMGIGAITEPMVTGWIIGILSWMPKALVGVVAIILVTFPFVVVGELVPKYVTLRYADRVALLTIRPLVLFVSVFSPIVWLVQKAGSLLLRPFGIHTEQLESDAISKEDLMLLVRSGSEGGSLEEEHAQVISKALKFDVLNADDIMVHRIDIEWLDLNTSKAELMQKAAKIGHSRIPVCRSDIDDVAGVLYLQDMIKNWHRPDFELAKLIRPVEAVPENLPLNKVINRMREAKSQILIVIDEYGGTSGLITLEDVVEEVFGELEDQLESERPPIEIHGLKRLSARADVRYDEVLDFLGIEHEDVINTDTLAQMLVNSLDLVPRLGDSLKLPVGIMRVENMARRRITRVSIQLARDIVAPDS